MSSGIRVVSNRLVCLFAAVISLALSPVMAADLPNVVINNESGAIVQMGSLVTVCGTIDGKLLGNTCLMVDRRPVSSKSGNGRYSLTWDTSDAGRGEHYLEIAVVNGDSKKIVSRTQVTIVQNTPVRISLPSDTVALGPPQKITVDCTSTYSPTRACLCVDSAVNSRQVVVKDGAVEWDTSNVPTGNHTLQLTTWDSANFVACSRTIVVKVPSRLAVKAPDAATITEESPHIALGITICDGLEVRKVTAWCDGKVASDAQARCTELNIPGLELESGKHEISVELIDGSGTIYKWGPQQIPIDNQYMVAMAAKAAADKAAEEAARKNDQELYTRALADLEAERAQEQARKQEIEASKQSASAFRLPKAAGTVGLVRGMCVVAIDDILEFGEIHTITAKVTEGHGTSRVNAEDVDSYFVESIAKARKYVMNYVAKAGYKADWMKSHIELHYQSDGPKGGDSAGAAMATAILSSLMKVPVRNDVVITGAIEPDGTIKPVGGLDLKAAAAFQDPNILTVIVPRSADNVAEVLSLPTKLLAGHRLVAAKDMGEVLRQALVGYDEGTLTTACQLFSEGITLYHGGKVNEAVTKLQEAATLTPEDMSIPVWIKLMKTSQK